MTSLDPISTGLRSETDNPTDVDTSKIRGHQP